MSKLYDAIVVGAGPAGLLAAKAAAESGLDVAVLERKNEPSRLDRACGQTLVSMNEPIYRNITNYNERDKRISFSHAGFSFKYDGPWQDNYNLVMFTPAGHRIDFGDYQEQKKKGKFGRVGLSIDKEALITSLLEEVNAVSVEVFPGILVDKVTPLVDRVVVEGNGQKFEGSYLIAADGCNSTIAKLMGMNEGRTYYCNFIALSQYISNVDSLEPAQITKTYSYLDDGAAHYYLIPRPTPGEYNMLTITVDPRVNQKRASEWLMRDSFCAPWFKKAKILKTLSAVCNCYSPIVDPYKDRILTCGDVGSTQELEIAGAMISGWKAGQAIATAVQENKIGMEAGDGINQYVRWWHDDYINFYNYEDYMKGMTLPYVLPTAQDLNDVFGLIDMTLPACWNPWTGSKAMGEGMAKALSVLEKTRPDLLKKLKHKEAPATELLTEITAVSKPVL